MAKLLAIILIFAFIISLTEGKFDVKLKYCRFKCEDRCAKQREEAKQKSKTPAIEGYYWRDFYGKIPDDAYVLGDLDQYPQTYIGSVFDPSKNGTFTTTIIEGLDYAYATLNGTVSKLNENIQILCSSQPEKLVWKNVTKENVNDYENYTTVEAPGHFDWSKTYSEYKRHFVVKYTKCKVSYAGYQNKLGVDTDFVLMDGSLERTKDIKWLLYEKPTAKAETKKKSKPYIRHYYTYSIKPDSIIPRFYKHLTIGSCSITCTNEGKGGRGKTQNSELEKKSESAMVYYWKNYEIWKKEEGVPVGLDFSNEIGFIGQTISLKDWFDVGQSSKGLLFISYGDQVNGEPWYSQILSSNKLDQLEWVASSSESFGDLDKTRIVPGGSMGNGTYTYPGRHNETTKFGKTTYSGSIREFFTGTYIYVLGATYRDFEVLMVKKGAK